MKNFIFSVFVILVSTTSLFGQEMVPVRHIDVTGKYETEVEPDEFILSLTISEYWEEEFKKKADEKDYRTKVHIAKIENDLLQALYKAGVKKDQVKVQGMGNWWRQTGKDFLISKQLEIKLNDFSIVNKVAQLADTKGFKNMYIREMTHSRIDEIEKEARINALQNAKDKATYLLESIGEKPGKVISVSETQDNRWLMQYGDQMMMKTAGVMAESQMESVDELKKIKISSQISARFSIAD